MFIVNACFKVAYFKTNVTLLKLSGAHIKCSGRLYMACEPKGWFVLKKKKIKTISLNQKYLKRKQMFLTVYSRRRLVPYSESDTCKAPV